MTNEAEHILIIQVYVDDIIFGATNETLSNGFAKLIGSEFEMSLMEELNFVLRLKVKQTKDGVIIHQQKCITELLQRNKQDMKLRVRGMNFHHIDLATEPALHGQDERLIVSRANKCTKPSIQQQQQHTQCSTKMGSGEGSVYADLTLPWKIDCSRQTSGQENNKGEEILNTTTTTAYTA
ncbi:hypothetical protein FXO38_11501 [Capsicum annuum]|nr:hypothetical protein FXO38_11501 [Capsicum annuum]